MYLVKRRLADKLYLLGIILIAVSLVFFGMSIYSKDPSTAGGYFILNFIITAVYFFCRKVPGKDISAEAKAHHYSLFLILSLISAYALNREIEIFEDSANWFSVWLVALCVNCMAFAYMHAMPDWAKHVVSFVNGVSLSTFLYLAIYLMPLYIVSIPALLLVGISFHSYVPLLFCIHTIRIQNRTSRKNNNYWISFGGGIIIVTTISILYLLHWNSVTQQINEAWRNDKSNLPHWINVAQQVPHTSTATKVLKGDMVYTTNKTGHHGSFFRFPGRNIGESRRHDPLIMIATSFSNTLLVDANDRIKVLEVNQDIHKQDDDQRFWSNDYLQTRFIETAVKLWPRCNLAYTEKTLTTYYKTDGWQNQGEAFYTFYIPEGSVVTSLSLWVNGKEEKGILTTKGLADSAYTTIVSTKRDPSIVHWKEGNSVTVRVFPIAKGEERKFKIGITSPLERVEGKLRYENIFFRGPVADKAWEKTIIDFEQPVSDFELPASFVSKAKQFYSREGDYEPVWGLQINDEGLSGCSYNFNGNQYSLVPYHKKLVPADITSLFLDINPTWTKEEFDKLARFTKDKNVFVYNNGIVKLDDYNKEELWEKLHDRKFSLFPFYELKDPEHSVLITKSASSILGLDELEGSNFLDLTKKYLAKNPRINLFNLGDDLSLYLRTFKEFRVFRYDSGNADVLVHELQNNQFAEDLEDDNQVIIHKTDMVIEKRPSVTTQNTGPDHVVRLFVYNHIMQKLGSGLFFDRPIEDSLVHEAREAYVVTPVSSLIVLETQKDYNRFGIKSLDNALGNASLHSKGSVPEPHEWALIVLFALALVYIIRKRRKVYAAQ